MTARSPLDEFRWRGLLHDATEGAEEALAAQVHSVYAGFDPTAPSLQIGNLIPVMGLVHLQRAGHRPIVLLGAGTGLIGDPGGKRTERALQDRDEILANAERFREQLSAFLGFEGVSNPAVMLNNLDWLGELRALDFLRDVGRHFSVNAMLKKESVRWRIEEDEAGINYAEFSYLLLQSYDFLRLYRDVGCRFQVGGSDQWGNITGGIELIRRVAGERAYGVVFPLVIAASGTKFGKTEKGAVWLDPDRTSPYRFYQFWLNADDADVGRFLRFFTLLPRDEIEALESEVSARPEAREAQARLAADVTLRVHGEDGLSRARGASEALFGGDLSGLEPEDIEEIFGDIPSSELAADRLSGEGLELAILLEEVGVTTSRGEARRGIEQGGIYLNGERVTDSRRRVTTRDGLFGRFLVLRRGKKTHHLVRVRS